MKFIHLSDLHIGKRVNEFSMLEDQVYILKRILNIIDEEQPGGVIIAGDVYDKSVPSAEAVEVLDDFLVSLAERKLKVYMISGNHDSAERLAFGNRLMSSSGIHLSPVYNGKVESIKVNDDYGVINIYMLPFIKPIHVRRYYPEADINSYQDAVGVAIEEMKINKHDRNLLVTHQFITGATTSDSEELSVGGSDNINVDVFEDFDYVALGHIHGPQNIKSERVRYCGTPLKYSFSEAKHKKSVTVLELAEKNGDELANLSIREVPLVAKRDLVEIKGTYEELVSKQFYENTTYHEDYMHITLTDEDDVYNAINKLRVVYPNLMKLDYDNTRVRHSAELELLEKIEDKKPIEIFSDFYTNQNGLELNHEQIDYLNDLIETIWEGE